MPIRLTASVTGLDDIKDEIVGLEERTKDLRPAFALIADLLELHVAAQFTSQGTRSGQPWSPLRPRTVLARATRRGYYALPPTGGAGPSGPILVWTGRLRGSFRQGSAEHVRIVSAEGLEWGTRVRYAGPLHRRRPILAFRDAFQQRELAFQPLRLWLQGVPIGAIKTVMMARLGLGAAV